MSADIPEAAASAPATDAAAALLAELVRLGVGHIVVSPGSRSQALALVAAELETRGLVRLHVRIDERVAGFTALGIGRETRVPAVVVCTSGTAVANLLPAVLEAHHAGVPLLLLTADRPPELRGVGANQTTQQPGMFEPAVRVAADVSVPEQTDPVGTGPQSRRLRMIAAEAFAAAVGGPGHPAGPAHLNVPLREPLAGRLPPWLAGASVAAPTAEGHPANDATIDAVVLERGPRTLVFAGADAGPAAEALAHEASWPLLAEVVSGARFGRALVHGYRAVLRGLGSHVERVVVFGHPTLAREMTWLLSRPEIEVIAVRGPGEPFNLNGATTTVDAVRASPGEADTAWRSAWMRASRDAVVDVSPPAPDAAGLASAVPQRRLGAIAAELGIMRAAIDRETLVDAVWRASWPHDRLVFGSSRLVRVADDILPGKRVPVHANRGLAGIDGTIATAMGIALASQATGAAAGVTRVLLGDLALLHDAGAFLLPPGETEPRLQVIVGNDGGGTIFDTLEVAATADAAMVDRVQYTPQAVDLAALARAYGWVYQRVTTRAELDQALTAPHPGRSLVEVPLSR